MNVDVAFYLLKKANVANATKAGLVLSYVVFQAFDIKGLVSRKLYKKPR